MPVTKLKMVSASVEPRSGMEGSNAVAPPAGGEQAAKLISAAQANMQDRVAKAMKYWEDTIALGQGNLAAMVTSSQVMSDGFKELTQQAAYAAKTNLEQSVAFTKSMVAAKSAKEAFELHSDFVRGTMESAKLQSQELQAATIRLAKQAAEPLTERMSISAAILKKV